MILEIGPGHPLFDTMKQLLQSNSESDSGSATVDSMLDDLVDQCTEGPCCMDEEMVDNVSLYVPNRSGGITEQFVHPDVKALVDELITSNGEHVLKTKSIETMLEGISMAIRGCEL